MQRHNNQKANARRISNAKIRKQMPNGSTGPNMPLQHKYYSTLILCTKSS